MKKPWSVEAAVLGSLLVGGIVAGCALVTGGTDGYSLSSQDAGAVDGACPPDAAICFTLACSGAVDCPQQIDGASGQCCAGILAPGSYGSVCAVGGCIPDTVQVCSTDAECGGALCYPQTCNALGVQYTLMACGAIEGCSPVISRGDAGSGTDAGTDAGSRADADAG